MNFEENICIDSFKFATDAPIDCRCVVEDINDIGNDKIFYDGCITYIKNVDTYIMLNNGYIQVLNMRHKVANLVPMLSELKFKDSATSDHSEPFITEENISTKYLFCDYTTSDSGGDYDNRLQIPYLDISKDYTNENYPNISSNANTVFNKYMRGYDCIMDFEHNIFVSKTCETVHFENDYRYSHKCIFFSFGRLFNPNTSPDKKINDVKDLSDDNFRLVKLLSDNISALSEVVRRLGIKVFTDPVDQESLNLVQSLNNSVNSLDREINSVKEKIRNKNSGDNYTSYIEQSKPKPVPAPKEYEHIVDNTSNRVSTIVPL